MPWSLSYSRDRKKTWGDWDLGQWQSICWTCIRLWVWSPAQDKKALIEHDDYNDNVLSILWVLIRILEIYKEQRKSLNYIKMRQNDHIWV
jgi:hypothetical protein